jgi:hypothetical protein
MFASGQDHYREYKGWLFLHGNPIRYLHFLQEGANANGSYAPERRAKPRSKYAFDRLAAAEGVPVAVPFALLRQGAAIDAVTGDKRALTSLLNDLPRGRYFLKPDEGTHGWGVKHLELLPDGIKIDGEDRPLSFLEQAVADSPICCRNGLCRGSID